MQNAYSRLKAGFVGMLTDRKTSTGADARVEKIRTAMLDALNSIDKSENVASSVAWADIARASDVQTLWYRRSDVLRLLSNFHGEQLARGKLEAMTELFRGLVPPNQMPSRRRTER